MVNTARSSFKLEANGALAAGVVDRYNATAPGTAVNLSAVVGTAPTTANLVFELRKETEVLATVTIPVGSTEVDVDLIANLPDNQNNQDFLPDAPPSDGSANRNFGAGDTFDVNIVTPGGAADLDVTVGTTSS